MLATLDRVLRLGDQTAIEHIVELVVLRDASVNGVIWPRLWLEEQLRKIEPLRFGVFVKLIPVQHFSLADHFVERAVAELSHQRPDIFGDEKEIVDDMLRLANEALAQDWVLRRDADRARVQMALAHHDAARGDQRSGRETELVRAQKRADYNVAASARRHRRLARRCGI